METQLSTPDALKSKSSGNHTWHFRLKFAQGLWVLSALRRVEPTSCRPGVGVGESPDISSGRILTWEVLCAVDSRWVDGNVPK